MVSARHPASQLARLLVQWEIRPVRRRDKFSHIGTGRRNVEKSEDKKRGQARHTAYDGAARLLVLRMGVS